MCGIAGCYQAADLPGLASSVVAITKSQRHRGPDHEAIIESASAGGSVVFGHNRLSIIDVSEAGHQPMWDADGNVCIVYNGEIYNYIEVRDELTKLGHRFITRSDTEVILEAFKRWAGDAFNRLNGMFAFALFDRRDGQLWLVRDRFGVKPLFYGFGDGSLLFASTPGPLARALRCRPNLEYVSRGLRYWLYEDDSDISPYDGVCAVPAGHYVVATAAPGRHPEVTAHRWYDFPARVAALRGALHSSSERGLLDEFALALDRSVRLRLRSDVPVGISLSGGLDSSTIAAIVSSTGADVSGFSFGDPDDPSSEGPLAAQAARRAGIPVTYATLRDSDPVSAFWEALAAQDAPFPDLSIVAQYLVFKIAHQAGLKVLLGGQGSDEVLMGYRKFQLMVLRRAAAERSPRNVLRAAMGFGLMLAAEARRAPVYLRQRDRYLKIGGLQSRVILPAGQAVDLLGGRMPAWRRQVLDVTRLSLPTLLRYEDRNSMGSSLETRLPFLDFHVAELAVALPDVVKVRGGYGKWILREVMRDRVPDAIRKARYKRGFDAPRATWIANGLGSSIRERLHETHPAVREWLPADSDIDESYSDSRLVDSPTAFAEATSLLWLASKA